MEQRLHEMEEMYKERVNNELKIVEKRCERKIAMILREKERNRGDKESITTPLQQTNYHEYF